MSDDFLQFLICAHIQSLIKSGTSDISDNLYQIGKDLAPKLLELYKIEQTTDLFTILKKIKYILDQNFRSKRSLNQIDSDRYYFTEYDLFLNKPNQSTVNPAQIIAGIIQGCLEINRFQYKVTIRKAHDQKYQNKFFFLLEKMDK